jgi:ABC-type multidrug transport system fused ATPase/permease subunit
MRCNVYMWISNRWLNIRTQFIGAIVAGGVAFLVVREAEFLGSTIAGLALVYSIKFTEELTYLLRTHSECQINMNSLERIDEYCRIEQEKYEPDEDAESQTPPESPKRSERSLEKPFSLKRMSVNANCVPANWPSKGEIVFENICMRYRPETPYVLK